MVPERLFDVGRTVSREILHPSRLRWFGGIVMFTGFGGMIVEITQENNEAEKIYPSVSRNDLKEAEGIKTEVITAVDDAIRKGRLRFTEDSVSIDVPQSLDPVRITRAQVLLDESRDNEVRRREFKLSHELADDSIGIKGTFALIVGAGIWVAGGIVQLGRMFRRRHNYSSQIDTNSLV